VDTIGLPKLDLSEVLLLLSKSQRDEVSKGKNTCAKAPRMLFDYMPVATWVNGQSCRTSQSSCSAYTPGSSMADFDFDSALNCTLNFETLIGMNVAPSQASACSTPGMYIYGEPATRVNV
jgi:hypothetical protein